MKLRWHTICPSGESIHLSNIQLSGRNKTPEHSHDFYECFFVEEGRGNHVIDGESHPLWKGELWFIRPEHSHGLNGSSRAPLVFSNIALKSGIVEAIELLHPFQDKNIWKPREGLYCTTLNSTQHELFIDLISSVAVGLRSEIDASFFIIGLQRILRSVVTEYPSNDVPAWLFEALPKAIEPENIQSGLPRIMQLCGRSPEHVSRTFQRCFEMTPSEWLMRERVRYARRLLETTHHQVIEIADMCGFQSLSHFHRCFKKHAGKTPLQFRKSVSTLQ